jgi:ABC-type lipoprotein release transport system permease subunit
MVEFLRAFAARSTWRMAFRNVFRNPRRTVVVLTAVAVGLGGIMLTVAVNFGMILQMVEAAIDTDLGHVQAHAAGFMDKPGLERRIPGGDAHLEGLGDDVDWARRLRAEGLVFSARASVGVRVIGIEPERERRVSNIASSIVAGEYLDGERRRLVVGERLAQRLKVGLGDKVVLSAQDAAGDMTGEAYRIGGLFRTSSRELDEAVVYLRLDESQEILGVGSDVSELVVVSHDRGIVRRDEVLQALRDRVAARMPGLDVDTWKEVRPLLDSMIAMFDQMGWIIYAAVFVAMAFGIANVLLMSVFERIREIGIMMAIGMPPARLVASILVEALVLTLAGVALGFGLGFAGVALLGDGIDLSAWTEGLTAFGIPTRIVPVLRVEDLTVPTVVAFVTAIIASLWPALRAVRTRPAEAVRHV